MKIAVSRDSKGTDWVVLTRPLRAECRLAFCQDDVTLDLFEPANKELIGTMHHLGDDGMACVDVRGSHMPVPIDTIFDDPDRPVVVQAADLARLGTSASIELLEQRKLFCGLIHAYFGIKNKSASEFMMNYWRQRPFKAENQRRNLLNKFLTIEELAGLQSVSFIEGLVPLRIAGQSLDDYVHQAAIVETFRPVPGPDGDQVDCRIAWIHGGRLMFSEVSSRRLQKNGSESLGLIRWSVEYGAQLQHSPETQYVR